MLIFCTPAARSNRRQGQPGHHPGGEAVVLVQRDSGREIPEAGEAWGEDISLSDREYS